MKKGDQEADWKYTGSEKGDASTGSTKKIKPAKPVSWTASEYIEREKSSGWYVRFVLVAIAGIAVIFLLTRDIFSVVLLSVLAVVFGIFAARKPQVLEYKLDNSGITIGGKFYPMNLFRSFAIIEEEAFHSITLLPMKRFMPAISLYYAPDIEQALVEAFGSLLPQEVRKQDPIDKLMHRIRF